MVNCNPIGVFDSGVGGLSILKEVQKVLPNGKFVYFGDTINLPYGQKTKEEVKYFTKNILDFFVKKNVQDVIVACNTTSALAFDYLKQEFEPKGLRIFPLIQTVASDIATGLQNGATVGIMATEGTAKSQKYSQEIKMVNPHLEVYELGCGGFVEIVENRLYKNKESEDLIKSKLKLMLDADAKKIVLGCTHYPYLLPILTKYASKELFFNPAVSFAQKLSEKIKIDKSKEGSVEFYVTSNPEEFNKNASVFYNVKGNVNFIEMPYTKKSVNNGSFGYYCNASR